MKTGDAGMPTTTALQARVPLFQATDRPVRTTGERWMETSWGRVRVEGRLGQRHADALQAVLHTARARRRTDDGSIELLIDPAAVRRCMSDAGYSDMRLKKLLYELRTCAVEIQAPNIMGVPWIIGGLIDHVEPSPRTAHNPLGGERHLLRVRLGKPLALLLDHDLLVTYDPAPIARLQYGISKAIVRHVKTHRSHPRGGWTIDGLIEVVAGCVSDAQRRQYRRRIHADASGMAAAGVEVQGNRASVTQRPDGVTQGPDGVTQGPGALHSGPALAAFSDISGAANTAP